MQTKMDMLLKRAVRRRPSRPLRRTGSGPWRAPEGESIDVAFEMHRDRPRRASWKKEEEDGEA